MRWTSNVAAMTCTRNVRWNASRFSAGAYTVLPVKNIVLFIDGTGNDGTHRNPKKKTHTNVFQLHKLCAEPPKLNLYVPGVGVGNMDLFGGAAGAGTKDRLRQAYGFLAKNYRQGDQIFLFGFSRGALAARLFAGFL